MAEKVILEVEVKSAKAGKDIKKVGDGSKAAAKETTLLSAAMNSVRKAMVVMRTTSKLLFGSIKAGLISTGIGAFVVIIGSLLSYLTNTKAGAEKLEQVLAGVGAAISVLTDRISKIGGAIAKVFSGDFKGAAKDLTGVLSGVGDEIEREFNQAIELKRIFQEITDNERDFRKERAITNQQIAEARLIAEDETKSLEERTEALQKANDLELQTTEKALELQERKTEAKRQEVALGESLAEDLDALAAEEVKLIDLQTQSFKTRKRLATAIETLRVEARAKQKARADERKKELKEIADAEIKLNNKTVAIQQELYYRGLKTKEEVEQAKLFTALQKQEKEIEASKAGEEAKFKALNALATKYADDKQAITDKYDTLEEEAEKVSADKILEMQQNLSVLLIEDLDERALAQIEIDRKRELLSVEDMANSAGLKEAINKKYNQKVQAQNKATSDAERKLGIGDLAAAGSVLGSLSDLQEEGTAGWKMTKIAEARINTFTSASSAYSAMAGIPVVGPGLGVIAAAAAILAGQKQVDAINATEIPKMARGGVVGGYGSGTSDSVNAKLSRGEVVINAKSAKMFRGALSNINVAGGGVGFARGGATTEDTGEDIPGLSPAPIKAYVLTDSISDSQAKLAKIRRRSKL